MIETQGIRHVALRVTDVERSKRFQSPQHQEDESPLEDFGFIWAVGFHLVNNRSIADLHLAINRKRISTKKAR